MDDQAAITAHIEQHFTVRGGVTTDHMDGLTVDGGDWWFNVRPSNTEPLLRLNVEAKDEETMRRLRDDVLAMMRGGSR